MNTKKQKLRFAALRRVSTEQQEKTGESLRTQTKDIENAVRELDGVIMDWYGGQEHATPGFEKREVNRLVTDSQRKRFDAVIVAHPDRWSRDNSHSRENLETFRDHRVRFFAATTEFDLFNPDHLLFLDMSSVIGRFFAGNQEKKSLLNRINRAKRGIPTGGKYPFGRKFIKNTDGESGHWEIDPEKQRMIEDAAKRYLAGEQIPVLAKEYGINPSNLHKTLTLRAGSKWKLEFKSKKWNIHEVMEMEIPPLLSDETIQAIHSKIEANKTYHHGQIKNRYLFGRMIQCDHCGYAMFGQTNRNGNQFYRHLHTERVRDCNGPKNKSWIKAEQVEDIVMRHLFETFGNPDAVQKAIEEATPNDENIREAKERREKLLKDIQKIKKSRERILGLIAKDMISDEDAESQLGKLNEREQLLEDEHQRIEKELQHLPSVESIKGVSEQVAKRFATYHIKGKEVSIDGKKTRAMLKAKEANRAFEAMTWEEKRMLCEAVFSGKTPDGRRMGIFIRWDEKGRWTYRIEGYLITTEDLLPIPESRRDGSFDFGTPEKQGDLIEGTKSACSSLAPVPPGCHSREGNPRFAG